MKQVRHRNDEPTILPADSAALVFEADGGLVLYVPVTQGTDPEAPVLPATYQVMRAAMLFGNGEDSEEARLFIDTLIRRSTRRRKT